jgi:DNA-binding winged helix-turn-helix (wHTH) protein
MGFSQKGMVRIGSVTLQADGKLVSPEGECFLPPRQHAVLECLVRSADQVVTKERLMSEVWPDVVVEEGSVHQAVKRLRKVLSDIAPETEFIETIPRRGYRLLVAPELMEPKLVEAKPVEPELVEPEILPDAPAAPVEHPGLAPEPASAGIASHPEIQAAPVAALDRPGLPRRAWLLGALGVAGATGAGAYWRYRATEVRARELYREAMKEWSARRAALRQFQEVVRLDPNFALAWVGIANCLMFSSVEPAESESAIRKALAIDPTCGQAYSSLGFLHMVHRWNWQDAMTNFERGVQLAQYDPTAFHWYGVYHSAIRRFETAHMQLSQAASLDPSSPAIRSDLLRMEFRRGSAETAVKGWLELKKQGFLFAPGHLVVHLASMRRYDEAAPHWCEFTGYSPDDRDAMLALLSKRGWAAFCDAAIAKLDPLGAAYQAAQFYALSNRPDPALKALEQALQSDRFMFFELNMDIAFESMRNHPGFQSILRRVGFPSAA